MSPGFLTVGLFCEVALSARGEGRDFQEVVSRCIKQEGRGL